MDRSQAITELKALVANGVPEDTAHRTADGIMTDLLVSLGYSDVVDAWEDVPKWYS